MRPSRMLLVALLAPDSLGNPQALRMGVEELIWDCGYDASVAHRNHIHIGLTKAGAARRTRFWSAER